MHPLAFHHKRLHLGVLKVGRAMFAHVEDMTPARFDLLFLIFGKWPRGQRAEANGCMMEQAALTKRLGLCRQTIWKLVKRLVDLGLVEKVKSPFKKRRITVRMTDEGVRRMRLAMHAAFSEREPLPKDAPRERAAEVPRYWKRPELADPVLPDASPPPRLTSQEACTYQALGKPLPLDGLGREVERTYTSFLWWRIGWRGRTGRRGKHLEHLSRLDAMIHDAKALQQAFGYRVPSIYSIRFTETFDH